MKIYLSLIKQLFVVTHTIRQTVCYNFIYKIHCS